jgi:hypothetical protein
MILRIWHLSDKPTGYLGNPYLHREVEDWMNTQIDGVPEEEWEAPDLAVTDPAGLTTFVAAFGLNRVAVAEVCGMGRLAGYPGELVFVGLAQKMVIVQQAEHAHIETEEFVDEHGERRIRPVLPNTITVGWNKPTTELRLRGLVVDKTTEEQTLKYVESRAHKSKDGAFDLIL